MSAFYPLLPQSLKIDTIMRSHYNKSSNRAKEEGTESFKNGKHLGIDRVAERLKLLDEVSLRHCEVLEYDTLACSKTSMTPIGTGCERVLEEDSRVGRPRRLLHTRILPSPARKSVLKTRIFASFGQSPGLKPPASFRYTRCGHPVFDLD